MIIATVPLAGAPNYPLTGGLVFEDTSNGIIAATTDDFTFAGSPDPNFAFSPDGTFDKPTAEANRFLKLPGSGLTTPQTPVTGRHEALLPVGIDPRDYEHVFFYCIQFDVLLGTGTVQLVTGQ